MGNSLSAVKSFFFDLYLKPTLLAIAIYQIIVSGTFTAQQILLAAYLDELGYFEDLGLLSGLILSVFFVFWFTLGPICGSLSDLHGRKFLLIAANIVSGSTATSVDRTAVSVCSRLVSMRSSAYNCGLGSISDLTKLVTLSDLAESRAGYLASMTFWLYINTVRLS